MGGAQESNFFFWRSDIKLKPSETKRELNAPTGISRVSLLHLDQPNPNSVAQIRKGPKLGGHSGSPCAAGAVGISREEVTRCKVVNITKSNAPLLTEEKQFGQTELCRLPTYLLQNETGFIGPQ